MQGHLLFTCYMFPFERTRDQVRDGSVTPAGFKAYHRQSLGSTPSVQLILQHWASTVLF
jgi:hypothetical protein